MSLRREEPRFVLNWRILSRLRRRFSFLAFTRDAKWALEWGEETKVGGTKAEVRASKHATRTAIKVKRAITKEFGQKAAKKEIKDRKAAAKGKAKKNFNKSAQFQKAAHKSHKMAIGVLSARFLGGELRGGGGGEVGLRPSVFLLGSAGFATSN
eukprot:CAMPEP_0118646482 /NCGR_PEP_ID=MMETSP0785-20121206/8080_1 /TAXON_ID=91992 /ORGANISM="Bolidomonas pacifica, Strain CCMP 1866" /LENGTH=153 /DNA_ID=CAMNT_0006538479 /DNA_START=266 /DNA_END=729 /DNA_ORIENTATION=-